MSKYQIFDSYDGTLGGKLPLPAGPDDVASPGGLSDIQHHWTGGLFGKQERTFDVYAGTGDRYPAAEYGNLYRPDAHGDVHTYYKGPQTNRTEYRTMAGDPYFWMNESSPAPPNRYPGIIEGYQPTQTQYEKLSEMNNSMIPYPTSIPETQDFELVKSPEPKKSFGKQHPKNSGTKSLTHKKTSCAVPAQDKSYTPVDLNSVPQDSKSTGKVCVSLANTKKWTLVILIVVLVFSAVTFNFWTTTIDKYIFAVIGKGTKVGWKSYLLYAIIATVILFFITYNLGAQQDLGD